MSRKDLNFWLIVLGLLWFAATRKGMAQTMLGIPVTSEPTDPILTLPPGIVGNI